MLLRHSKAPGDSTDRLTSPPPSPQLVPTSPHGHTAGDTVAGVLIIESIPRRKSAPSANEARCELGTVIVGTGLSSVAGVPAAPSSPRWPK